MQRRTLALLVLAAFALLGGVFGCISCSTIEVTRPEGGPALDARGAFSHEEFDAVLKAVVDARGLVDYEALRRDPALLDRYLGALSVTSPETAPALFPTREHRLAYWINAYNACVMKQVVAEDIRDSVGSSTAKQLAFFVTTRFVIGGETISLKAMEDSKVREAFGDARAHFALNCASGGCPRLRAEAFRGETLDAVLEDVSREFVAEERNVRIDAATGRVVLSKIFDWYGDDFLAHARAQGIDPPTLRAAVDLWRAPGAKLPAQGENVSLDYDWTLNAQAGWK